MARTSRQGRMQRLIQAPPCPRERHPCQHLLRPTRGRRSGRSQRLCAAPQAFQPHALLPTVLAAHALAVQRELLSAQCQIETFAANAPSHLLQRVSRQAVLSGHGPPERCWSGAAGRAGAALASLAVEAGPTLLDAAQNPAMLSVTGLMTPSACTFEQDRISSLISTLYTSAAQATDHGTDTAKRDILEGSAESREARWTTSERLSAHRSLWFQDRSVQ